MSEEKQYDVDVDAVVTVSEITDEPNPPEPEPGPPDSSEVQAPGSTGGKVTDITNTSGLGLNVVGGRPQAFEDYTSDGTWDSAVLLGPGEGGSSFKRFHLDHAASLGAGPGYGRHALYCKGPDVTCEDWWVRMDPKAPDAGSGWSVRFAGFSLDRFDFEGNWFASLYDDDPDKRPGRAHFRNGRAVFASSSAIWCDTQIPFDVVIENADFWGPSGLIFDTYESCPVTLELSNCTINDEKATAASVRGVPADRLTIS